MDWWIFTIGIEIFSRREKSDENPCAGNGKTVRAQALEVPRFLESCNLNDKIQGGH